MTNITLYLKIADLSTKNGLYETKKIICIQNIAQITCVSVAQW
jgi:hypothetical protein